MNMNLNIISLNVPYPPDYGGMIDTYYRIHSLHNLGVRVHLHCFEYGRQHSKELESLCETTCYYPRKSGLLRQFSTIPYIVSSRKSEILLDNLIRNDYPILFDGLHSTFFINHPALSNRKKLVRLHNIEHKYYHALADNEKNFLKKGYFLIESAKLKRYEKVLREADYILPISVSDHEYFINEYHNSICMAPFHPFYELKSLTGTGEYVIFHGDLSVNENYLISDSLISNVFSKIPYKCIIAGKDPPGFIKTHASRYSNILVISNPDNDQMTKLIVNAQIHILPALAANGFKLKLLMALYAGRHCLVNPVVEEYAPVKNLFHVANTNAEILNTIHMLMKEPFTYEMILERQRVLSENFDVRNNAMKLIELAFNDSSKGKG
ncbi:MAG: glycosyltransferase family 1 protein [Bacteroidales bacterium]|nr:glycosyltransferase family 1 protein [Bacteroidales bacterium]